MFQCVKLIKHFCIFIDKTFCVPVLSSFYILSALGAYIILKDLTTDPIEKKKPKHLLKSLIEFL